MKIAVTGARGFVGRNLCVRLGELEDHQVLPIGRGDSLEAITEDCDVLIHLAGENRGEDATLKEGNAGYTQAVCDRLLALPKAPALIYASTTHVERDTAYGQSKLAAETILRSYQEKAKTRVFNYRLPGLFGKWARPNYNSVVATWCHNIARGLPIKIDDPAARVRLLYIDDLIDVLIEDSQELAANREQGSFETREFSDLHEASLEELAEIIRSFRQDDDPCSLPDLSSAFRQRLYSTYVSQLDKTELFSELKSYSDDRGAFVELFKQPGPGQISFSTSAPGVVRGNHYHHSKIEKFIVLRGSAEVNLRLIGEKDVHTYRLDGKQRGLITILNGYTHNIVNVGDSEMELLIWSNEVFDRDRPDTIFDEV